MSIRFSRLRSISLLVALLGLAGLARGAEVEIRDKTLVVWAAPANTTQQGTGVLTIQRPGGPFDSVVLGELAPGRWMAGSEFFHRTHADQAAWPAETAGPETFVQIAVAYRGKHVSIHRDGRLYAEYDMASEPAAFSSSSVVLLGLRHLEMLGGPTFLGRIEDARIYPVALNAEALAKLRADEPSEPKPLAWWTFDDGEAEDRMGTFPPARLMGAATVRDGRLHLDGGYAMVGKGLGPTRTRATEDWPTYHVTALPSEGLARPYDANGCIYWKGKYHLMYIYQDPKLPKGGHCWGHAVSTDLVDWTFLPPALVPQPEDKDVGIFSGNAFLDKDGVPTLCWFGVEAGVCVATAQDDDLIAWKKHPRNPIIPMPKPGEPGHGEYTVWDPYLWLEGDDYICLLGGNKLPNGKDTLYTMKSPDLVSWTPVGPFFEHPDLSWTTEGEDCSCPDFFKLGDKRALLCISHKVGGRLYIGRYENERFFPEKHVRMSWPGGQFFAPESLLDDKGRRIIWAWVTDPRTLPTQQATGSGVQSLPRVIDLDADGNLTIKPVPELERLRRNHRRSADMSVAGEFVVSTFDGEAIRGDAMELALWVDPAAAEEVAVAVRSTTDDSEKTVIRYTPATKTLAIDSSKSTRREDVVYTNGPLDTGGLLRGSDYKNPRNVVEAPLELKPGEPLTLRIFLDGPMLEVFANDRQCLTQQVFPESKEATLVKVSAKGGPVVFGGITAWDMDPAKFIDQKGAR
ncbi:GH32 C-terminal domain-containing protein [Planctomyces sp. SH-PL62]|uniref:GH32 C-terminal domain-containing protein n=1 Tax=Planctomyces sp. SH-PL62 TaxID=1636152 RepID=UPI00078DF325|nr:GH32 C-terminal domain-containing protein [Planctomyces sp. SH-PL62]AMV40650.1 Beta-fructosidase [Planctomyces sp. SH-PL62]